MPADKKVSVAWQIVFTFIPIADLWAFYRIRKLRRYLLYVIVPAIVISIIVSIFAALVTVSQINEFDFIDPETAFDESVYSQPLGISSYAITAVAQGLSIYLVIIWSRQHNRQYDQQTSQPSG